MLSSFRKFSNSIVAKIFLIIVAIPFIFWGMGDLFSGGNQKTIVTISKDKISTDEFINYLNFNNSRGEKIDDAIIDKHLATFIGEKLILKEIEDFDIKLSDISLSRIIKNQEIFTKENKFSRTKYEEFLINNNIIASTFEKNISKEEKRKQLLDFIGGGTIPSSFLVNINFDKINQKRDIQLIDLNKINNNKKNFTQAEIQNYFESNKEKYKNTYKSVKFIRLDSQNLVGFDEVNDLFFKKIDEIDDLIVEGKSFDFIYKKFKLENFKFLTFDINGKDKKSNSITEIPEKLIKNIFKTNDEETVSLTEHNNNYFLVEIENTDYIQKNLDNPSVKTNVIDELIKLSNRKLIASLISKINNNNFKKDDFDKFSNEKNLKILNIKLNDMSDIKVLKSEIVREIYSYPPKRVILVSDVQFAENYLVYVDNVESVSINKDSKDFEKYFNLSKVQMLGSIYNTYDFYLKNKYEIDINQVALSAIKNNF